MFDHMKYGWLNVRRETLRMEGSDVARYRLG